MLEAGNVASDSSCFLSSFVSFEPSAFRSAKPQSQASRGRGVSSFQSRCCCCLLPPICTIIIVVVIVFKGTELLDFHPATTDIDFVLVFAPRLAHTQGTDFLQEDKETKNAGANFHEMGRKKVFFSRRPCFTIEDR